MNIISVRRGFEADHSSTHSEYIHGFTVTCDYDWWTCEFSIPYDEELFKKIAPYNVSGDYELFIERQKDNILAGDSSDLELLKVYVEGSIAEFRAMDSSSGIESILDKAC